jgi:hypothetical protein
MPSSKNRKPIEKDHPLAFEPQPERSLNKIKFNISMDNLRPFVEPTNSARTYRTTTKYSQIEIEKEKKTIKTEESKP